MSSMALNLKFWLLRLDLPNIPEVLQSKAVQKLTTVQSSFPAQQKVF